MYQKVQAELVHDSPAETVAGFLSIGSLERSPHEVPSRGLEELAPEYGRLKVGHVIGRRDNPAAGNFVAGVQRAGVLHDASIVLVIPARAVRNHGEEIIVACLVHSRRLENILAQEVDEFFRRSAFEHATGERVTVGRIVEFRAGLGYQRITGKELKRLFDAGEMPGAIFGNVALPVRVVVADTTEVSEQFPRRDGPLLLRKRRTIFLHRSI